MPGTGPGGADLLNGVRNRILKEVGNTFTRQQPIVEHILKNGNIEEAVPNSTGEVEFDVIVDDPATIVNLSGIGNELVPATSRTISRQGRARIGHEILSYAIGGRDLGRMKSEDDVVKILKKYPIATAARGAQLLGQNMLLGNKPRDMAAFLTFNGDQTYEPNKVAENGLFTYAPRSAQTATVFGLVKEAGVGGCPGWYNQYGNVAASFGTDGRNQMSDLYYTCQEEADPEQMGEVDFIFSSVQGYQNYEASIQETVRVIDRKTVAEGDLYGKKVSDGVMYRNARLFRNSDLSAANLAAWFTNGGSPNGVMFYINSKTLKVIREPYPDEVKTQSIFDGMFQLEDGVKLQGQYVWQWMMHVNFAIVCTMLRSNGVLTGVDL